MYFTLAGVIPSHPTVSPTAVLLPSEFGRRSIDGDLALSAAVRVLFDIFSPPARLSGDFNDVRV